MSDTNTDTLTREQHIFLWKTQGGNYTWAKWASMHNIPAHSDEFIKAAIEAAKPTSEGQEI